MARIHFIVVAALFAACASESHAQPKDAPKTYTNSLGMKFVWIAPGSFLMGSSKEERLGVLPETLHRVTLTKGFFMGVHTVTQGEWEAVMGKNPSSIKGEKNLPVDTVSWHDCQNFIKKLRAKDKDNKPYRLPTEAEWEYACRAGTWTAFHTGESISTDQANFDGSFAFGNGKPGEFRRRTTPVGSFPANAWGLHDMHGNVWQWCQDWFGEYPSRDVVDPQGPEKGGSRVLRGGCWRFGADYCRSAYRHWLAPEHRYIFLGFRVCFTSE
jgi:formylglycine-generating enzyme required for sulfatase activity